MESCLLLAICRLRLLIKWQESLYFCSVYGVRRSFLFFFAGATDDDRGPRQPPTRTNFPCIENKKIKMRPFTEGYNFSRKHKSPATLCFEAQTRRVLNQAKQNKKVRFKKKKRAERKPHPTGPFSFLAFFRGECGVVLLFFVAYGALFSCPIFSKQVSSGPFGGKHIICL